MSVYLLAFVVGEFDFVEDTDSNGVLVRVYTPVGKAEQGRFALDVSREGTVWRGAGACVEWGGVCVEWGGACVERGRGMCGVGRVEPFTSLHSIGFSRETLGGRTTSCRGRRETRGRGCGDGRLGGGGRLEECEGNM